MKVTILDISNWIKELKNMGFNRFSITDLKPHNLDRKEYLKRANFLGFIRKVGYRREKGDKNSIVIWEITR